MFEWDERKRLRNLAVRGVDFRDVMPLFESPERVEFEDARKDYGERRLVLLGPLEGRLFHVTYTMWRKSTHHFSAQGEQTGAAHL